VDKDNSCNLKKMLCAKKKGMLVVCDRYPQNQCMGFNDGPALHSLLLSKNPVLNMLAKLEANMYKKFDQTTPDIVFKLVADPTILEARKPGKTRIELLKMKNEGIRQLTFPAMSLIITLNAEEPIEKILFTIKTTIWEMYN
jgi:hypothetical protein